MWKWNGTLAVFIGSLPSWCLAQSAAIVMDGRFDDWTPGLATFTDNNAPTTGIDLLSMQVANDDQYLFLKLVVGTELDLQDDLVPQTIRLYIDGDNNASTGNVPQTGYGAELQVKFDTRVCTQYVPASTSVSWASLDLVPLPTVTSNTFEIAIARNAVPDGVHPLFTSNTIRILFKDTDVGDAMPNAGSTFSYTFDATPVTPYVPIDLARTDPDHVRITAWNVLADGITQAAFQDEYQRILSALAPDVIGFSECVTTTAAQVKTRLDTWLPTGGSGWFTVKDDYDMIIAARWPIVQTWPALSRQFPVLIDLPSTCATDLLFNAAHLNCCTADATRQQQCDAWAQFVLDAKSPGGTVTLPANTPFVMAGDFNAVGYAQQLNTLITGAIINTGTYGPGGALDWDGTDLSDQLCPQTDARMDYTWRSDGSAYPSGRLDYFLFSDAAAPCAKSFTLRTESMTPARLALYGLNANDNSTASDHCPVTADLAVPLATVKLNVKVLLEGPYDQGNGLMHDSLRVKALLPTTEPYSALGFTQAGGGGEAIGSAVLSATGNDAIVDWVLLGLRDKNNSSTLLRTRAALLQRDGDVIAADGTSPILLDVPADQYFIAVRHRNHLGVMTASAVALGSSPFTLDLTTGATSTYGAQATKSVGSLQVMWEGNTVRDGVLKYTGSGSDREAVLVRIGGVVPTATAGGYLSEDVTLDGTVKYTGVANDREGILQNIGGVVPTNTRSEQLP